MKKTFSFIITIIAAAGILFAEEPLKKMITQTELATPVDGEYIGEVNEIKQATGEIFIKKKAHTLDVQVFDKLYNKEGDRFILLNIDSPYITAIKCRAAKSSDFALIQKGMKFYRYYTGAEKKEEVSAVDFRKAGELKTISGIEMVYIPSGNFVMGDNNSNISGLGWGKNEIMRHKVTLNSFYMSKYTVTQSQYEEVMGANPSSFKNNPNNPIEMVSWYQAVEFCNKLSIKAGLTPYYAIDKNKKDSNNKHQNDTLKWTVTINSNSNGFRLPTEAEWEYACRAGTTSTYYWGGSKELREVDQYVVYKENSYDKGKEHPDYGPHRVGSKKPNAWGLYDMCGNVLQWCWDWYGSDYYKISPVMNPLGMTSGSYRVIRGGSWYIDASIVPAAYRLNRDPSYQDFDVGFRVVSGVSQ